MVALRERIERKPAPGAKLRRATHRVLAELARIAFADIGDVFDERGSVIPFADLPPGVRSAIAEYRVHQHRNGTSSVRVKMHSKLPALTALMRHLGDFDRCRKNGPLQVFQSAHRSAASRSVKFTVGMGL